jgi:uncharacterized coiled-coil protein SlyX
MLLLLAQLSAEEVGVLKLALSVLGALFTGLITWVAVYMRSKAEKVEQLDKELGLLKQRLEQLEEWRNEARPKVHLVGNVEQRVEFLEGRVTDCETAINELERTQP